MSLPINQPEEVFPAHAGVIPGSLFEISVYFSIPRACGGDPKTYDQGHKVVTYSPRMRG